jgi:hypothetical protein
MMQSFLEEVVEELWKEFPSLEDLVIVLPNKRAGTFLINYLAKRSSKPIFLPKIYSIEEFVESISGLKYATNTQLQLSLYASYLATINGPKESFYEFSQWGTTLLSDFNEVDRYLIAPDKIFSYLSAIQEVNHWYLKAERTEMMNNYIKFWNNLQNVYEDFNRSLLKKGIGYQGMVYKMAHEKLQDYIHSQKNRTHVFIGFNALNAAESQIIQQLLAHTPSKIYWDNDPYFIKDPLHDAGFFLRHYLKQWPYFKSHVPQGIKKSFLLDKEIQIVGIPKQVSQVKYIGQLLKELSINNQGALNNTAIVLGDETLLNPLINSIPKEVGAVNITMGYPLHNASLTGMFLALFDMHLQWSAKGWFYKQILDLLSQPIIQKLFTFDDINYAQRIEETVRQQNLVFLDRSKLCALYPQVNDLLYLILPEKPETPQFFVQQSLNIIKTLKEVISDSNHQLELEYLFRFYKIFNQLDLLITSYDFIKDLKSLRRLFREIVSSESVDFRGEPLQGLQVMGMLESRNLDFDTVIMTSVNEGILPAGKSANSFIPFDVKREFGIPTYKEKDAVYTYHFYRLLMRAKKVYLLYNTEPDVLEGGEKSRFIAQLLTDEHINSMVSEHLGTPVLKPNQNALKSISKNAVCMDRIRMLSSKGLSPTKLTNYIRNPIDFYKSAILGIEDYTLVEETIAANTLGTIVHDTLEEIYTPMVGEILTSEALIAIKPEIKNKVEKHFNTTYKKGGMNSGKNLIAFEVITRYIEKFITQEIEECKNHQIKIVALEAAVEINLNVPNLDYPVKLKGKLDRIDEKDGLLRIIDYKTGNVNSSNVEIVDWPDITEDYKFSKAFQLMCYALLYEQSLDARPMEAGIISFKNINSGLLRFATKSAPKSRSKTTTIDSDTRSAFRQQLFELIQEICDPTIPFLEKEV